MWVAVIHEPDVHLCRWLSCCSAVTWWQPSWRGREGTTSWTLRPPLPSTWQPGMDTKTWSSEFAGWSALLEFRHMVSFSPFRTPTSARLLQLLLILLIPHLHFFYHYPKITSSNAQKRLCCYQCSCFHCQLIAVVITALHWHLVGNSWKVQKGSPQAAPGERALLQACLIPRTSHRSSVCVCVFAMPAYLCKYVCA